MLIDLLGYVLLGLLLALPLGRLLYWLATRYKLYTPRWHYLRPYLPNTKDVSGKAGSATNAAPVQPPTPLPPT